MTTYILRRLLQIVPLLLLISIIGFSVVMATGDPLSAYTSDTALSGEDMARLRAKYGLDQPLPVQYANWIKNLLTGDWGTSYYAREPVTKMVFDRLPNTMILVVISFSLTLLISTLFGIISAVKHYSFFDHAVTTLSFIGVAMPAFWLGLMLIVVLAVRFREWGLPYFPVGGMFDFREGQSTEQILWHTVLPSLTLSFVMIAKYTRYIRSSMLEQISQDYVRTARAKGLAEWVVLSRHAFKNVLLPVITLIGMDVPALLSGTIVIESIFAWPGMGRLFWDAALRTDIPVLMALMMFVATLTVFSTLMADILYAAVDPRIRYN